MVCKLMKKGVMGAALGAGALYLAFGTSVPSYVRTAFHKIHHSAKDSVPISFQIDRARDEISRLEPAILENRETLARAEVDVEHLKQEIATVEKNLAGEKSKMVALRDGLETGDLRLAKNSSVRYTVDEVKGELANRLDHYRNVSRILEEKVTTLKAREKAVEGARAKLREMAAQKSSLAVKLESIQARLQAIEATQEKNEFNFDDSSLSRAKQAVSDLERRLEVKARMAEMEGLYPTGGIPTGVGTDRDVLKEFDSEFGSKDSGSVKTDKKSL